MSGRRPTRPPGGGQLLIGWEPRPSATGTATPAGPPASAEPAPPPQGPSPSAAAAHPVQALRWDFLSRFPEPTEAAIGAGLFEPGEDVAAIHLSHERELRAALRAIDAEAGGRPGAPSVERGTTGNATGRLQRWYANVLGLYADLFGPEAADAFDRAVRAWHARVEVVVERRPDAAAGPAGPPRVAFSRIAEVGLGEGATPRRAPPALPVPRPLPEAVAAGHFGHDERGPVDPSPDEVREVTEEQATRLVCLIRQLAAADDGRARPFEVARWVRMIHDLVAAYADDFGVPAAERLLAYARRRQRSEGESQQPDRTR